MTLRCNTETTIEIASSETDRAGERAFLRSGSRYVAYARLEPNHMGIVIFLPGGGHRGRIAYGHQGSDPRWFLDFWLARQGYGLIALSHAEPVDLDYGNLSLPSIVGDWAAIVTQLIGTSRASLILAGWSVAGRSVSQMGAALARQTLSPLCFISLAATPPFPGLVETAHDDEHRSATGAWAPGETILASGLTRKDQWHQELVTQLEIQGVRPLPRQDYFEQYLQVCPIALRGEPHSPQAHDLGAATAAMASFVWQNYPICCCIAPDGKADARHALTDAAMWSGITIQALTSRLLRSNIIANMPHDQWSALLATVGALNTTLHRRIDGGHFFFVGPAAAHRTTEHIHDLAAQARNLARQLPLT